MAPRVKTGGGTRKTKTEKAAEKAAAKEKREEVGTGKKKAVGEKEKATVSVSKMCELWIADDETQVEGDADDPMQVSRELDLEVEWAQKMADAACIGLAGLKWCDEKGTRLLNVETQKYNARELNPGHWKALASSLLGNNVKTSEHPVFIAVNPDDLENPEDLLSVGTENPRKVPVLRFKNRNALIILLAGQHRLEAQVHVVPQLFARSESLKEAADDWEMEMIELRYAEEDDVEMKDGDRSEEKEDENEDGNDGGDGIGGGDEDGNESEKVGEKKDGEDEGGGDNDGKSSPLPEAEGKTPKERLKDMRANQHRANQQAVQVQHWLAKVFDVSE